MAMFEGLSMLGSAAAAAALPPPLGPGSGAGEVDLLGEMATTQARSLWRPF
jgi:hypothetical protein